ncbi:MAG TPA: LysM peptidoglycan-binding domain-containing protein [Elusimicrobiales bacterium]|nr:LysM peptidoglycan-binding domain-containing protein [Elusimicrobiales bacterium]
MPVGRLYAAALALLLCPAVHGAEEMQSVIVKPGDTLWSIANKYLKDPRKWNELLRYNRLPSSDPSIALPGSALKVPVDLVKEQYRAARLVQYVNDVRFRKSGGADWNQVRKDLDLYRNDTLRTMMDSRADVRFYTGEILNLYPNSIAVLRPPDKKADVELKAGEMRGIRSRVVTASARIMPRGRDTEFGARIKEDLTTLVQVYKGRVDVEAQGKTVEVAEGFAAEVKLDMPPSQPVQLPPLPEFEGGERVRLSKGSAPQIKLDGGRFSLNMKASSKAQTGRFSSATDLGEAPATDMGDAKRIDSGDVARLISVANPVQAYHLQVARDVGFTSLLLNRNYDAFDEVDLAEVLPPGNYWMRVSYVDLLGFEGKFNAPRAITVGKRR